MTFVHLLHAAENQILPFLHIMGPRVVEGEKSPRVTKVERRLVRMKMRRAVDLRLW
jgi:hypothetical protein